FGQFVEEVLDCGWVVGVECCAGSRRKFARRLLQPFRVAGREDDVGALAAGEAGSLEADACAAANHDDGLAMQARLTRDCDAGRCGSHGASRCWVMSSVL